MLSASSQPRLADTGSASGVLVHYKNKIVRPGLHAVPDVGDEDIGLNPLLMHTSLRVPNVWPMRF